MLEWLTAIYADALNTALTGRVPARHPSHQRSRDAKRPLASERRRSVFPERGRIRRKFLRRARSSRAS